LKIPRDRNDLILKSDMAGIPIDYKIHNRRDWEEYKAMYSSGEWRLYGQSPISDPWLGGNRDLNDYRQKYDRARREGKFACLVFREPYEAVREFLGTDGMLGLMAEDPGLVREMFEHNCRITLEMIDLLRSLDMPMDGYWVWGDIAYTGGMFFSPSMYRELLMPVHQELFNHLGRYFVYHTDGNMRTCLPLLVEAGIRGINPIEIKAGNDFFEISDRYGDRIVLTGGIDVTILGTNDRDAIEKEVRTKLTHAKGKRYIFHSDHSIPPSMSLDSYRYLIELVDEHGRR
jgi:uroporphyrinogen decarboxylase